MRIQRIFPAETSHGALWIGVEVPEVQGEQPPRIDYDALNGANTLEVSLVPKPNQRVREEFAARIGQFLGVETVSVEWTIRDPSDETWGGWPVAAVSFGDRRGWDMERVSSILNAAEVLGHVSLIGMY